MNFCERCNINHKESDHKNCKYCRSCRLELKSIRNKFWRILNFEYNKNYLKHWKRNLLKLEYSIKLSDSQKRPYNGF